MDLKRIVRIAMMAALIFAGTYTFKIPIAITGGYTHPVSYTHLTLPTIA